MPRRIIDQRTAALVFPANAVPNEQLTQLARGFAPSVDAKAQLDDYNTKVLKLVPADVVAVFVLVDALIRADGSVPYWVYWMTFMVLICITYFYVHQKTALPGAPPAEKQALVSAVSFAIWVFALGGPFSYAKLHWYHPVYGAIVLPLYTLAVPLLWTSENPQISGGGS